MVVSAQVLLRERKYFVNPNFDIAYFEACFAGDDRTPVMLAPRSRAAIPIWCYMYDSTVRDLSPVNARFPLTGLAEPRIDPEIVLQVASPPHPDMSDDALLECIAGVAHGFGLFNRSSPAGPSSQRMLLQLKEFM